MHDMNVFFEQHNTLHETFPFDRLNFADYEPAMMKGMEQEKAEIDAIINNPEQPTFENTILALEHSGKLLDNVTNIFYNMLSANTTPELEELAQKMSPLLSEHSSNITLNTELFARIKVVYDFYTQPSAPKLGKQQMRLLTRLYEKFMLNGVNLPEEKKEILRSLRTQMGTASLKFSQNLLNDKNLFEMHITDEADLEGLTPLCIEEAKEKATEKGKEGWIFTLQAPCYGPFLRYSAKRALRERMWRAYNTLCTHDNEYNNFKLVREIVNLSRQIANILGFNCFADCALIHRMASNPATVNAFIDKLVTTYKPHAVKELARVEEYARKMEGEDFKLMPWDFPYYSNKVREELYNINSEMLRPYLELSKVKQGVFGLANKLYGINFTLNKEIQTYHPDVEAYEVTEADGTYLAVLYCDFHPRESKKSGAWMTSFKEQWKEPDGTNSRPHVSIVMNLTKPTATSPALLTLGEVETFLHEFGHALHGIFANSEFKGLSGTNVYWDFVELPSQFMENYSMQEAFLNSFASHYETGEPIPHEYIERLIAGKNYNEAYACMRQLSFCRLDMWYYTQTEDIAEDIEALENAAWADTQLFDYVPATCMSTQFGHIMSGGYAAGYYSYKWAEVLDADAFSLFLEKGIFDRKTAQSFRENILSRGNEEHPMTLYKNFRGSEPTIDALLKRNGITAQ